MANQVNRIKQKIYNYSKKILLVQHFVKYINTSSHQ